ncbi:hypothetical protein PSCICO_08730 [Pseudomonas cichorii]|nr:hypothetical protein PSCICO_08730 [Pseudomonas cichorii]
MEMNQYEVDKIAFVKVCPRKVAAFKLHDQHGVEKTFYFTQISNERQIGWCQASVKNFPQLSEYCSKFEHGVSRDRAQLASLALPVAL